MIKKMKVLTLVGTRPEIIKLSLVLQELERSCEHVLVHSGQNFDYELNEIFFNDFGLKKPDYFLNAVGESPADTIGRVITELDKVLEKEQPDAFLIYGDTNSCLGVIAAKKRKIPIFHLEAGNRCFDQRVPEEVNRKIVDHLSDINFVHSEHARNYLLNEGLAPEKTFKSGSPMPEIFNHYQEDINNSKVLGNLNLKENGYFVLSSHREENVDNPANFNNILISLDELTREFKKKIIFSTHPRTMKKLEGMGYQKKNKMIEFMKPLGFFDYIKLQKNSFCVLSDSGTLTEEASLLKFPGVMIRQAHERPEGSDRASVVMSDLRGEAILRAVSLVTTQKFTPQKINDYDTLDFSSKIVRSIVSYTDFINRTVWQKDL